MNKRITNKNAVSKQTEVSCKLLCLICLICTENETKSKREKEKKKKEKKKEGMMTEGPRIH